MFCHVRGCTNRYVRDHHQRYGNHESIRRSAARQYLSQRNFFLSGKPRRLDIISGCILQIRQHLLSGNAIQFLAVRCFALYVYLFDDGYRSNIIGAGGSSTNGGMNCTGFVWFIISHSLAHYSGNSIATTGAWVPNVRNFNSYGFSRNCWSSGGWYTYITQKNVHYYEFSTKSEMLSSGRTAKR